MPRIIGDELFDSLMQCVKDQRLLGVMGKLERLRDEAVQIQKLDTYIAHNGKVEFTNYQSKRIIDDGPETNNN